MAHDQRRAISVRALSHRFGRRLVLDGLDLDVPEGAFYALLGANGAGKTTLLQLLTGAARVQHGSVSLFGVPLAHTALAMNSISKGLNKLELNEAAIRADLDANWAVVAEAIQTILRKEGYPNPYEALKVLTRKNENITKQDIHLFIDCLETSHEVKAKLKAITPFNYTGI